MKTTSRRIGCLVGMVLLLLASLHEENSEAAPGEFWYGLQNVGATDVWGDSVCVWAILGDRFKMNWVLANVNEGAYNNHVLDSIKAYGIRVLQYGPHEGPYSLDKDSAIVFWKYSNGVFLGYEAEGDTIYGERTLDKVDYRPEQYGGVLGEFVRHPDSISGYRVFDAPADGGAGCRGFKSVWPRIHSRFAGGESACF